LDDLAIWLATVEWNGCPDPRPWVLIDQRGDDIFGCFPIASECYEGLCFALSSADRDFAATGLDRDCHIHTERIYELRHTDLSRRLGFLQGDLLKGFWQYAFGNEPS